MDRSLAPPTARRRPVDRVAPVVRRWRSSAASAPLAAALVVVAAGLAVLGKVSEDVVAGNGLERHDLANLQFVTDHRTAGEVKLAHAAAVLGSVGILAVLGTLVALLLWWKGARLAVALAPLASLAVTGVLVAVVKHVVGRVRPTLLVAASTDTEPSFPSGHSADSTALFLAVAIVVAVVVLHRPLTRVLCVAAGVGLAGVIGLSRLVLAVHWPTDVLAGWALGTVVAVTVCTALLLLSERWARQDGEPSRRLAPVMALAARRRNGSRPTHPDARVLGTSGAAAR